ncbi:hypothetical protein PR048_033249 [Dryococelus australis]|uniref:Uncharacterized protein n=1 Tax=Dryococelus australis TaxID=614101 RepID=A0ABQ9G0Q5_9NEOP|nr:hypothetical protein PR048_033249 [Dryococelus australis]
MSAYTRQQAKNRVRLERASQKQYSDAHETPYDRVERCRERKINIKASERVNVDVLTQNTNFLSVGFERGTLARDLGPLEGREVRRLAGRKGHCRGPSARQDDLARASGSHARTRHARIHHSLPFDPDKRPVSPPQSPPPPPHKKPPWPAFNPRGHISGLSTHPRQQPFRAAHIPLAPRWLSGYTARLPPRRTGFNPRPGHSRIFANGNRAGRCRRSAGFLRDLPFPSPLHSGAAPCSSRFTLAGSQCPCFESRSSLLTHSPETCHRAVLCTIWAALNKEVLSADGEWSSAGIQGRGKRYPRGNPPTSGIVRHDPHSRKSGSDPGRGMNPIRLGGRRVEAFSLPWGRGGAVVRLLASHLGNPGSIPSGVTPAFSQINRTGEFSQGYPRLEKSASSFTCRLDATVLCTNMPMSSTHWLSADTVEGDDWASVPQEVSNTLSANGDEDEKSGGEENPRYVKELTTAGMLHDAHKQPMRLIEVNMEQCWNEKGRGEPEEPRENPPVNGIVRHGSHLREPGVTRPGIEPLSSLWHEIIWVRVPANGSLCLDEIAEGAPRRFPIGLTKVYSMESAPSKADAMEAVDTPTSLPYAKKMSRGGFVNELPCNGSPLFV